MRIRVRVAAAVLSALSVAGVAACSGTGDQAGPTASAEPTPAQRLAEAKKAVDAAPTVHLKLTSSGVPKDATGVLSADGWGAHPPAFKGSFKVSLKGTPFDAELTSVGGEVWAKLPLIPGTNKINVADFGLPDPATLFSPDKGLTNLLTATVSPTAGDKVRSGQDVLTTISGTLPGARIADLFRIGDRNATFKATYGLTDAQQLRQVELTGPFFGAGSTATYTLVLDQYGKPVTIAKP